MPNKDLFPPDIMDLDCEEIAGGVVMIDISEHMPRHKFRRYPKRQRDISKIWFHKSGILGAPGFNGAYNSAFYCVTKRKVPKRMYRSDILGWAGMPYTFWLPFDPLYLDDCMNMDEIRCNGMEPEWIVLFRCQPDEKRTWHTGGWANQEGVGAVFQGTGTRLSASQIELAEALIPWAVEQYPALELPRGLSWHSDRGEYGPPKIKPVCPGPAAVHWLREYREAA